MTARAPVRNGSVNSFRFKAAAGECSRVGRPAVCWLKRLGFARAGAVFHPYVMPRLVIVGRRESGRRNEGGNWMAPRFMGNLGAIVSCGCLIFRGRELKLLGVVFVTVSDKDLVGSQYQNRFLARPQDSQCKTMELR